jgi:biopolymer transport protein ExbD
LLASQRNLDRDIPVLIRADVTTQLGKVTYVWDACRKHGLVKIALQSQ